VEAFDTHPRSGLQRNLVNGFMADIEPLKRRSRNESMLFTPLPIEPFSELTSWRQIERGVEAIEYVARGGRKEKRVFETSPNRRLPV
jgi:hypothetical protein